MEPLVIAGRAFQSRLIVGTGKYNDDGERVALDVKAGDTILFGKYSGQEIKLDGVEYLIMKEDEVLAAFEPVAEVAEVPVVRRPRSPRRSHRSGHATTTKPGRDPGG